MPKCVFLVDTKKNIDGILALQPKANNQKSDRTLGRAISRALNDTYMRVRSLNDTCRLLTDSLFEMIVLHSSYLTQHHYIPI